MSDTENVPVESAPSNLLPALYGKGVAVSPALAIMLDDKLFTRCRTVAAMMSAAVGFIPKHLIGKTEACFAIVSRSIVWKLDPWSVACSTFSPADGKVGYEGKLCQAVIENSGQVVGGVTYHYYGPVVVKMKNGTERTFKSCEPELEKVLSNPDNKEISRKDWNAVLGKFIIKESSNDGKSKKYAVATYTDADEMGLGVIARAQVKGEAERREYDIMLRQAWPRNSTLWATDPLTQLGYRAARGLGHVAMPGIFMGVPIGDDAIHEEMIDVTPAETSTEKTSAINERLKEAAAKMPVKEPEPHPVSEVENIQENPAPKVKREEQAQATLIPNDPPKQKAPISRPALYSFIDAFGEIFDSGMTLDQVSDVIVFNIEAADHPDERAVLIKNNSETIRAIIEGNAKNGPRLAQLVK